MSISWGPVVQVDPALWARVGYTSEKGLHLMTGAEDDVQKMEGVHYWKLAGRWYVQHGGSHYSDDERDLFGYNPLFIEVHDNLDDVIQRIETAPSIS